LPLESLRLVSRGADSGLESRVTSPQLPSTRRSSKSIGHVRHTHIRVDDIGVKMERHSAIGVSEHIDIRVSVSPILV